MSKNSFILNDFVFSIILCKNKSKAQKQYIQGFFKKKPCQRQVDAGHCSSGQSQSTRQGQVGQQISSPEPGSRSEPAIKGQWGLHQNPSDRSWEHEQFFQKVHYTHTHTHTHTCLFGQWKKLRTSIVCSVVFIYKKKDELSRHLCCALFMSSHLCWGTRLFPWAPPDWILPPAPPPPRTTPLKQILESPLLERAPITSPPRLLCSQNSDHLIIPRISKSTAGGKSFSYLMPKLWNNLPNTVREADTLSV